MKYIFVPSREFKKDFLILCELFFKGIRLWFLETNKQTKNNNAETA